MAKNHLINILEDDPLGSLTALAVNNTHVRIKKGKPEACEETWRCLNIDCQLNKTTKESYAAANGISKKEMKKMNWSAITSLRHLRWRSSVACAMQSNKEEDKKRDSPR